MNKYNTYDFDPDTPFIPLQHCCCGDGVDMESINKNITNTIDATLDAKFACTNKHIHCATHQIIDEIKENAPCMCHVATKHDIQEAINCINYHTDSKFEETDFIGQFENLNNQIKNLQQNGSEIQ